MDLWTSSEPSSSAAVTPDSDAGTHGGSGMPGSGVRHGL